jgi:hypothetical protein
MSGPKKPTTTAAERELDRQLADLTRPSLLRRLLTWMRR